MESVIVDCIDPTVAYTNTSLASQEVRFDNILRAACSTLERVGAVCTQLQLLIAFTELTTIAPVQGVGPDTLESISGEIT